MRDYFKFTPLTIFLIVLTFGCSNYYEYKYLKNMESNKGEETFQKDYQFCQNKAFRMSPRTDGSTTYEEERQTRIYKSCILEKGWRKKDSDLPHLKLNLKN